LDFREKAVNNVNNSHCHIDDSQDYKTIEGEGGGGGTTACMKTFNIHKFYINDYILARVNISKGWIRGEGAGNQHPCIYIYMPPIEA